jgi:hypothetical protein
LRMYRLGWYGTAREVARAVPVDSIGFTNDYVRSGVQPRGPARATAPQMVCARAFPPPAAARWCGSGSMRSSPRTALMFDVVSWGRE